MRKQFQPFLSEERIPAFKAVKSVFNITRERGWRPIWEKELGNVLLFYNDGKVAAGFLSRNAVHCAVSYWLWGRIVQELLVRIMDENQTHRIRRQKGILLPSGARRIYLYTRSPEFGPQIKDRIITVDQSIIDDLLATYDRPEHLMFGSPEDVVICEDIYKKNWRPPLSPRLGWEVFEQMISCYDTLE